MLAIVKWHLKVDDCAQLRWNEGWTLRLREIAFREDIFGSKQAIEGGGKPCVNGHLHNYFHYFFARASDIERTVNMHFQLRCGIAESSQRCDNADFSRFEIKLRARVDIAERELD